MAFEDSFGLPTRDFLEADPERLMNRARVVAGPRPMDVVWPGRGGARTPYPMAPDAGANDWVTPPPTPQVATPPSTPQAPPQTPTPTATDGPDDWVTPEEASAPEGLDDWITPPEGGESPPTSQSEPSVTSVTPTAGGMPLADVGRFNPPGGLGPNVAKGVLEPDKSNPPPEPLGIGETASRIGGQLIDAAIYHLPAAAAAAWQGFDSEAPLPEPGIASDLVERGRQQSKKQQLIAGKGPTAIKGLDREDINSLGPSLGFSGVGMAGGLTAGVGTTAATAPVSGPGSVVAGYVAGMGASGTLAYRMAANQFVRDLYDAANEENESKHLPPLTRDEFNAKAATIAPLIREYGLWEAVPEAASNALGFGILKAPIKSAIGEIFGKNILERTIKKTASLYGEELATETVTQQGQHNTEIEAKQGLGLSPKEQPRSWTEPEDVYESLKEVAPATILQTTLMAGGMKAHEKLAALRGGAKAQPQAAPPASPLTPSNPNPTSVSVPLSTPASAPPTPPTPSGAGTAPPSPPSNAVNPMDWIAEDTAAREGRRQSPNAPPGASTSDAADIADVEQAIAAPHEPAKPGTSFTTAKGSTYEVHDDGTTTRNKSYHPEHGEQDQGPQPRSEKTVYVDSKRMGAFAPPENTSWRIADHGDGTVSLVTRNQDGKWGVAPESKNIKVSDTPEVGMTPLELWGKERLTPHNLDAYSKMHPGNEITKVSQAAVPGTRQAPIEIKTDADIERIGDVVRQDHSAAQGEAHNVQHEHADWHGNGVTIEAPAGGVRRGTTPEGKPWEQKFTHAYGYIKGTKDADGMELDAYVLGAEPQAFVLDELDDKGKFRQHKTFLGATDSDHAREAYLGTQNKKSENWGGGRMMTADEFNDWKSDPANLTKPVLTDRNRQSGEERNKVLRAYGYPQIQIDRMGEKERVKEWMDAVEAGVKPEDFKPSNPVEKIDIPSQDSSKTLPGTVSEGSRKGLGSISPATAESEKPEQISNSGTGTQNTSPVPEPAPEDVAAIDDAMRAGGEDPKAAKFKEMAKRGADLYAQHSANGLSHVDALRASVLESMIDSGLLTEDQARQHYGSKVVELLQTERRTERGVREQAGQPPALGTNAAHAQGAKNGGEAGENTANRPGGKTNGAVGQTAPASGATNGRGNLDQGATNARREQAAEARNPDGFFDRQQEDVAPKTESNEAQYVIPGAERISMKEHLERKAREPKRVPKRGRVKSRVKEIEANGGPPPSGGTVPPQVPKTPKPPAPMSAMTYLASRGGLIPNAELKKIGLDYRTRVVAPGMGWRNVLRKDGGMTMDEAREALIEGKYLPNERANTPSDAEAHRKIYEMLSEEHNHKRPTYPQGEENADVEDRSRRAAQDGEDEIDSYEQDVRDAVKDTDTFRYITSPDHYFRRAATIMATEGLSAEDAWLAAVERENLEDGAVTPDELLDVLDLGDLDGLFHKTPTAPSTGATDSAEGVRGDRPGAEGDAEGRGGSGEGVGEDREAQAGSKKPVTETKVPVPSTEKTAAGEQFVLPGTEKISAAEQAQRGANKPLKPKADQKPADHGLFSDEDKQSDIKVKSEPAATAPVPPKELGGTPSPSVNENPPETIVNNAETTAKPSETVSGITEAEATRKLEEARQLYHRLQRTLDGMDKRLEEPVKAKNSLDQLRLEENRKIAERNARNLRKKVAEALDAVDDARAVRDAAIQAKISSQQTSPPARISEKTPIPQESQDVDAGEIPAFLRRNKSGEESGGTTETSKTGQTEQAETQPRTDEQEAADIWGDLLGEGTKTVPLAAPPENLAVNNQGSAETPKPRGKRPSMKPEAPPKTKAPAVFTEIGKNADGRTLYEDRKGVRSYVENGVRVGEAVQFRQTRGGIEYVVDRTGKPEWEVAKPDQQTELTDRPTEKIYAPLQSDLTGRVPHQAVVERINEMMKDGMSSEEAQAKIVVMIRAAVNPTERTAGAAAKSAAKNVSRGTSAAVEGLFQLFNTKNTLGVGITFDEETWKKAKPFFIQATKDFSGAFKDMREFAQKLFEALTARGLHIDDMRKMQPYLERFTVDVKRGNIDLRAEAESPISDSETNNERSGPQEGNPGEPNQVPAEGGRGNGGEGDSGRGHPGEGDRGAVGNGSSNAAGVQGARGEGSGPSGVSKTPGGGRRSRVGAGRTGANGKRVPRKSPGGDERGREPGSGPVAPEQVPSLPATNFRITDEVNLGEGGEATKFRDNLAAIDTLKEIEREQRRATPDEQRILARYVGWGGLANAFRQPETQEFKPDWKAKGEQLETSLTKEELRSARSSTQYAHYTSRTVIDAMWNAVKQMGFAGGITIETSAGTGNFLGLVPEDIAGQTKFIAVEKDGVSARIAKLLYPQETVLHAPFEAVPLPDGEAALVIGNPPFSQHSLMFQNKPELTGMSMHNQFLLAGLDALRPGGVQAVVVSRYVMDSMDTKAREMMAIKANLIGAIRLPDTAFKENAGTEVVTDILFFQRRTKTEEQDTKTILEAAAKVKAKYHTTTHIPAQEARALQEAKAVAAWIDTVDVRDPLGGAPMKVNQYFASNPRAIMGQLERSGTMQMSTEEGKGVNVRLEIPKIEGETAEARKRRADRELASRLAAATAKLPSVEAGLHHDVLAASLARHEAMSESLAIALAGSEVGHVERNVGGKLTQVSERETQSGDYELTRRVLSPTSPWSRELSMDNDGRWYAMEPETVVANLRDKLAILRKLEADREREHSVAALAETRRVIAEVEKKIANAKPDELAKDGKRNIYVRKFFPNNEVPASMRLGDNKYERLVEAVSLRDLTKRQLTLEAEDAPAAQMEANRRNLARAYEGFVGRHGLINDPRNMQLLNDMPDGAIVLALEFDYRPAVTNAKAARSGEKARPAGATPAPILSRRVVPKYEPATSADSAADAVSIVLSESGRLDMERIASLLGTDEAGAIAKLTEGEKPLAYLDPETKTYEPRNAYLSGQVAKKLAAARVAGLTKNAEDLKAVLPERWTAENVTAIIGNNWIPPEVYANFANHLLGTTATAHYSKATNAFALYVGDYERERQDQWGTPDMPADAILRGMLNSKVPKVLDPPDENGTRRVNQELSTLVMMKAREIENEFADWVFKDGDRRNQLVDIYNDKFNTRVTRQHDGTHLKLPGKVPDEVIKLRRHQMNAVWRGIYERFMLLDHVVGAGKTYTAIARAMERRRMGLSRKPMIAVPNHLVEQWTQDVYRLYPGAKVLAAGSNQFNRKNRRRLFARVATGDWDMVIVPHSSFGFIGIDPATELRFLDQDLKLAVDAVREAKEQAAAEGIGGRSKPFTVKEAEKLVESITARMEKLKIGNKDRMLTFEQMGVDDLTVDEAHEFKNLFYSSRLTGVRGMGNKQGSQKAFDLYNKVRTLREGPNGTVTFMTGTPISNSAVEMFTILRYLAANDLKDLGLEHFDAWRSQYVSAQPAFEPTEAGGLKEVTRLGRSWSNMRSLMELYYSFTDAVSQDDINKWHAEDNDGARFPVPRVKGGGRQEVVVKPTPAQMDELGGIVAGFNMLPEISNPIDRNKARLRLMDRARKVSLDVRAANKMSDSKEEGGKLDQIADQVARIHKAWAADKGTQLIFLDRGVKAGKSDGKRVKEYDELVAKRDAALSANDEDLYRKLTDKLDEYDPNEMKELRIALQGGWNAYDQLKENLIKRGVPANEIRFVQEANSDAEKRALFDLVREGTVRVLIGSTPKMGAGTNVQRRLVALHHADVTWKPSDIEQREGRIIRQSDGNPTSLMTKYGDKFEVEILAYATERTVDAKMWDLNSQKLRTINGIRKYNGEFNMEFEDEDAVGMAEIAALASGDPLLLERVKLISQLDKLEMVDRAFRRRMFGMDDRIQEMERAQRDYPAMIKAGLKKAEIIHQAQRAIDAAVADRSVTVEGKKYDSMMEAVKAATDAIELAKGGDEKARYAIMVDGQRLTNKTDIQEAIENSIGDVSPFEVKRPSGETWRRRSQLAKELSTLATNAIAKFHGDDAQNVDGTIGKMGGLDLKWSASRGRWGDVVSLWLERDGVLLADAENSIERGKTKNDVSTQLARSTIDKLFERAKGEAGFTGDYLQSRIDEADAKLPVTKKERAEAKFPQAEEMATTRKRLEEVIRTLDERTKAEERRGGHAATPTATLDPTWDNPQSMGHGLYHISPSGSWRLDLYEPNFQPEGPGIPKALSEYLRQWRVYTEGGFIIGHGTTKDEALKAAKEWWANQSTLDQPKGSFEQPSMFSLGREYNVVHDANGKIIAKPMYAFEPRGNLPLGMQAQQHVMRRGIVTGLEHLTAIDANGNVVESLLGNERSINIYGKLLAALEDPNQSVVVHHNHPNDHGFSNADISTLGHPGMAALWAHGHRGTIVRASLTPQARATFGRMLSVEARSRLFNAADRIDDGLNPILSAAVAQRSISEADANRIEAHAVALILHRAGVIDYDFSLPRIEALMAKVPGLDQHINMAAGAAARELLHVIPTDRRPTQVRSPLSHPGEVGTAFENARSRAAGPVGASPNQSGPAGDRADQGATSPPLRFDARPPKRFRPVQTANQPQLPRQYFTPLHTNWRAAISDPTLSSAERRAQALGALFLPSARQTWDRIIDLARLQRATEMFNGAPTPQRLDVHQAAQLYPGRAGERVADVGYELFRPIADAMQKHNVNPDEIQDYLYARHAEERNMVVGAINPAGSQFRQAMTNHSMVGASGMSTDEANAILAHVAMRQSDFDAVAALVDAVNVHNQTLMETEGLEHLSTLMTWNRAYRHYVPLRGEEVGSETEHGTPPVGTGFSTRGPESMRALGRGVKAGDILAHLLDLTTRLALRAETNRVGKTLARFVIANPNPDVYKVGLANTKRGINPATGMVELEWVITPAQADRVFPFKVAGDTHYVEFAKNQEGLLLAMKNMGVPKLKYGLQYIQPFTRMYATFQTAKSPDFVLWNFERDIQEAGLAITAEQRAGFQAAYWKNLTKGRALMAAVLGMAGTKNNRYAQLYEEWRLDGGKISTFGWKDVQTTMEDMRRDFNRRTESKVWKVAALPWRTIDPMHGHIVRLFETLSDVLESTTRLAVYAAARDIGMTRAQGATASRAMTVDFSRGGEMKPIIQALYAFGNPAIQGSVNLVRRLVKSRRFRYIYGVGIPTLSFMLTLWNLWASAVDDDDEKKRTYYEQLKQWDRDENIVIFMPGAKDAWTPSLNFLARPAWAMGENAAMAAMGKIKISEAIGNFIGSTAQAFNPLGTKGSAFDLRFWGKTISPTLSDPIFELGYNRDWLNRPIHPEERRSGMPHSQQSKMTTNVYAEGVAQWINSVTGGSTFAKGSVLGVPTDFYPDDLEYAWNFMLGGYGKFMLGGFGMLQDKIDGIDTPVEKIPFVRRMIREGGSEQQRRETYYEKHHEAFERSEQVRQAIRAERAGTNVKDAQKTIDELGDKVGARVTGVRNGIPTVSTRAETAFRDADHQLTKLRTEERELRRDRNMNRLERMQRVRTNRKEQLDIMRDARDRYQSVAQP